MAKLSFLFFLVNCLTAFSGPGEEGRSLPEQIAPCGRQVAKWGHSFWTEHPGRELFRPSHPEGATVLINESQYIVYKNHAGQKRILFDARFAYTNGLVAPNRNLSRYTEAFLARPNNSGELAVFVREGRHRAAAAANGIELPEHLFGAGGPWMDYEFNEDVEDGTYPTRLSDLDFRDYAPNLRTEVAEPLARSLALIEEIFGPIPSDEQLGEYSAKVREFLNFLRSR